MDRSNTVHVQTIEIDTPSGKFCITKKIVIQSGKMDMFMLSRDGEWVSVLKDKVDLEYFRLPIERIDLINANT